MLRVSLIIAVAMSIFWSQDKIVAKEADELEEALMVKLLEKRAKKRTGDDDSSSSRLEKSDLKFLKSDDKSEISAGVVSDVKGTLKEPFLTLLASSELISWAELSDRVGAAKKALEIFEVKYRSELASGGKTVGAAAPAMMPGANKVVATMPGAMPGVRVAMMPGAKPGVAMAAKKPADDDDDDDDDDDVPAKPKPKLAGGMPGIAARPAGMPGVSVNKPAGMPGVTSTGMPGVPVNNPAGMPGVAPIVMAAPGGMPGVAPAAPAGMPGVAPMMGGMPMAK